EASETIQKIGETHPGTLIETLVHVFPSSVVDSLVRGDILQIVAFAVLFAMAVSSVGEKGKPLLRGMESLSQVMFKLTNYVMKFAPIGVGAAMAHTIGTQGPGVLVSLGNLIFSYYLGLIIFIGFVFGLILVVIQAPIRQFVSAIRSALASLVIARWEGEFDDNRARVLRTPAEAERDVRSGDVAFAEAAGEN